MTGAKFDIEKFDGTGDFGLWRVKICALLIQHGYEAALEVLPADMEAQVQAELNKKAHSAVILCLGNKVLREVIGETTVAGVWSKLETLYMTKSLANKFIIRNTLWDTCSMTGALTLEDVMATLNSKEIKERSKAKGDDGEGLYVRGRTDRRDSCQSRGKSRSKSQGGRLKCYICPSEDHLKRNCPKNNHIKSTGYVYKDDQPISSGSIYDGSEVMMVMSVETLLDWIMDLGGSYHMTPRLDLFFDYLECDGGRVLLGDNRECKIRGIGKVRVQLKAGSSFLLHNVRYIPELKRNLISLGTLKKEGYTVKLQSGKIKVINGSRVVLSGTRRDNCVYSLDGHVVAGELNASVEEKDSLAQVWHKRLGHISEAGLQVLEKQGLFGKTSLGKLDFYKNYVLGKSHRVSFGVGWHTTQGVIDYVHSDLCGPSQVESLGGKRYFLSIVDDYSRRGLSNRMPEEDHTDQEDGNDENAGDQETDQTPDLTDYQLVQDREPRTRTIQAVAYEVVLSGTVLWRGRDGFFEEEYDWELVDHLAPRPTSPPRHPPLVSCKRLFQDLKDGFECVQRPRYKARLVARRFTQRADDMLISCKSKAEIGSTKTLLKKEFDMKELGEAKKILGMEIIRDRSRKIPGRVVYKIGYVSKILNNFRIDNGKSVQMPLGGHFKLSLKDCPIRDCDVERMSKVLYANVVGSLMYLMVCTRPDITYAVSIVSRYLANPGMCCKLKGNTTIRGSSFNYKGGVYGPYGGCEGSDLAKGTFGRNHVFLRGLKHINVAITLFREVLKAKTIEVLKVGAEHNAADALTKVVPGHKLQHCLELLSVGIG
ncbi:zinc finger, CCHC-type containing protein [Tanacetum coccineum]|uniref:Zinc finger, CCHC-type containing protein n=1 Tax=Tanacetum coccineum TaxID=301880 RepID=A0ABQ5IQX6_9ASTR